MRKLTLSPPIYNTVSPSSCHLYHHVKERSMFRHRKGSTMTRPFARKQTEKAGDRPENSHRPQKTKPPLLRNK